MTVEGRKQFFENFLIRNNAYTQFYENVARLGKTNPNNVFEHDTPDKVMHLFPWAMTPEGVRFWWDIETLWTQQFKR